MRQLNGTSRQPNAAGTGFESCSNPAWAIRGADTLRTIPFRISGLREPSPPQFDMSLNKSFNFTESVRAQFRAEAFNITNTPIFRGPEMNPNNTNFGRRSLGIANFPRQIQFGFKLYF